ncbi:unnamed protein product, partial [Sphacelaria rigidula]
MLPPTDSRLHPTRSLLAPSLGALTRLPITASTPIGDSVRHQTAVGIVVADVCLLRVQFSCTFFCNTPEVTPATDKCLAPPIRRGCSANSAGVSPANATTCRNAATASYR